MSYGGRSGIFDSVLGLDIGNDLFLQPIYAANSLFLKIVSAGAVPEPTAVLVFAVGLVVIAFAARRRRHGQNT